MSITLNSFFEADSFWRPGLIEPLAHPEGHA